MDFPGGELKIRHDVRQNPTQERDGSTFHLVFLPNDQYHFMGMEAGVFSAVDSSKPYKGYEWSVVHEYEKARGPFDRSNLPQPLRVALEMIAQMAKSDVRYHSMVDYVYNRDTKGSDVVNIAIHVPGTIEDAVKYQRNLLRKIRSRAWQESAYLADNLD
jgi:hypothetical protein